MVAGLAIISYSVVFKTLPKLVSCDAISSTMIRFWKKAIYKMPGLKAYWVKLIQAQRPVAVYYALTKIEQQTKGNYYAAIMNHTITVILLV